MKVCRFHLGDQRPRPGLLIDDRVVDLSEAGIESLTAVLEEPSPAARFSSLAAGPWIRHAVSDVHWLPPVDRQEVWAAGVTYLRSKAARMEESNFSAQAYDRVYDAPRPEIFFKSLPEKVVGPHGSVGIRADARWSVPEPELALVLNSRGELAGYTIGNDMSSRDIEGENLLYLPQAKTYERSCAIGPCLVVGVSEADVRTWTVQLEIRRQDRTAFAGETSVARIKRTFGELAGWLFRCQRFPRGAILLTGTGIVPPNDFSLEAGDRVRIRISGIGLLENDVIRVGA